MIEKRPKIGQHVIYVTPTREEVDALVTADWGGCINLTYVSQNEKETDQYGRQLHREATSVMDWAEGNPGRVWRYADMAPHSGFAEPIAK